MALAGQGNLVRGWLRANMVHSQTEAKRLFVEKVVTQARLEGVFLSDAERAMLSWSESDPDFVVDSQSPARLAAEISDEEYEKKVTGLLARRFVAEVDSDPAAKAQWKQAAEVLHQGDHYILIMLDAAVRSRLKPWWQFWRRDCRSIDACRRWEIPRILR